MNACHGARQHAAPGGQHPSESDTKGQAEASGLQRGGNLNGSRPHREAQKLVQSGRASRSHHPPRSRASQKGGARHYHSQKKKLQTGNGCAFSFGEVIGHDHQRSGLVDA